MTPSLYTPPSGYYDAPFTWLFDGSSLTDGSNALNLSRPILGGFGDFVMRRVVGLDRLLNAATGQFQYYDQARNALQHVPQDVNNGGQFATVPEVFYKENSSIYFDLYNVHRAITSAVSTAQLAFQGVRRKPGNAPWPTYPYRPRTLTYCPAPNDQQSLQATISHLGSTNIQNTAPVQLFHEVRDYDWDLYQIIVTASSAGGAVPFPAVALWIYDSDRQQISNLPMLDIYINGAWGSTYVMGAIVPPLFYPIGSQIRIDVYSCINNAGLLPVTVNLHCVGQRRYPCS